MLGGSSHKGTKHSFDCSETETLLLKNPELFSLNKKIQMNINGVFHFSINAWKISFSAPLTRTSRIMKKCCWKGKSMSHQKIDRLWSPLPLRDGESTYGKFGWECATKPWNHDCLQGKYVHFASNPVSWILFISFRIQNQVLLSAKRTFMYTLFMASGHKVKNGARIEIICPD